MEVVLPVTTSPEPRVRACLSLSHVSSLLWHCNMWETYSVGYPQSLGHAGEGHDPLVAINFPVGGSLAASLAAHISCLGGAFFVSIFRASQSTWGEDVSWSVSILCQRAGKVFLKLALSIESLRLLETLFPSTVFHSPSGYVGTLVKSLQFLSWVLWDCNFGNPAS